MKKLLSDPNTGVCEDIRLMLESHGIRCVIRNDSSEPMLEGNGAPICSVEPEVWVVDDEQFGAALALLNPETSPAEEGVEEDAG